MVKYGFIYGKGEDELGAFFMIGKIKMQVAQFKKIYLG